MRTALVLGGGGPVGIAWEAGLLLGLRDGGVDLSRVDRIIGTSAGVIVGTHLAVRGSVDDLYQVQSTPLDETVKAPEMAPLMTAFMKAKLFSRSVEGLRKSIGKSARAAALTGEAAWIAAIASFLPTQIVSSDDWPERDLVLTAVDAETGELMTWTRTSGVALCLAVASSCAVPCVYPLVRVGDRTYMDGGIGSPTNAALASGFEQVVILDPLAHVMGNDSVQKEQRVLEEQGSRVQTFTFDENSEALIGTNMMDARQRGPVAELGRAQGRAAAQALWGRLE